MTSFLDVHKSKDGPILILLMKDDHLINVVKQKLNRLLAYRNVADTSANLDRYSQVLFGMPKVDIEDVARSTRDWLEELEPYIMAMYYRSIHNEEVLGLLHQIVPDPRGGEVVCLPLQENDGDEDVPF